jgi:hypothetical protein
MFELASGFFILIIVVLHIVLVGTSIVAGMNPVLPSGGVFPQNKNTSFQAPLIWDPTPVADDPLVKMPVI